MHLFEFQIYAIELSLNHMVYYLLITNMFIVRYVSKIINF